MKTRGSVLTHWWDESSMIYVILLCHKVRLLTRPYMMVRVKEEKEDKAMEHVLLMSECHVMYGCRHVLEAVKGEEGCSTYLKLLCKSKFAKSFPHQPHASQYLKLMLEVISFLLLRFYF
ncbi:hypothetical protein RJT34_25706 [Clitoria ternatea]|uniref:Uncharacterized protein n=1 Tax=Clitoria ternatea TaxID=43366 RepID=A0AAN9FT87_CLITE